MVSLGCDYSYARPGGAALKAAGVTAAGRYLASDSRGITNAEYRDLVAHGVGVWLVREGSATGMLNGRAQGISDAQIAVAQIQAQGLPADSPVYWAADFDIAPGTPAVAAAEAYVDGWNTVIPAGRRGGYGGLWFLNYIHGRGKADFLWECASTSFRHGINPADVPLHLQQTTDTPPVPGTDHNNIFDTTSFAGTGGVIPIVNEEDTMKLYLLRNGDGSGAIGVVNTDGTLDPLTASEYNAIVDMALQEPAADGTPYHQLANGADWNILAQRTARIRAAKVIDPAALAQSVAALVVPAVLAGVQAGGVSLTETQVEAAAETAIKTVFATASK